MPADRLLRCTLHLGQDVYKRQLVDLDDIQARVAATLEERHLDIPRVEALIDEETSAFMRLLAQRDVQPTVALSLIHI